MGFVPWAQVVNNEHPVILRFAKFVLTSLQAGPEYLDTWFYKKRPPRPHHRAGWDKWLMDNAAELADLSGKVDLAEVAYAVVRAIAKHPHMKKELKTNLQNVDEGALAVVSCMTALRSLLAWRKERVEGDIPPVEYVAFCLARHWGRVVYKDTWPEISCDLAMAFPEGQLPMQDAEAIVAEDSMQEMTPPRALAIAKAAVERVRSRHGLSGRGTGQLDTAELRPQRGPAGDPAPREEQQAAQRRHAADALRPRPGPTAVAEWPAGDGSRLAGRVARPSGRDDPG